MIDTHAHVNFHSFKDDFEKVMQRAKEKKCKMILVGSQYSTSERAVEMAQSFDHAYAAVGLHPIQLEDLKVQEEGDEFTTRKEDFDYEKYLAIGKNKKVVAIGETGLDFYHIPEELNREEVIERQKKVFQEHIRLANELDVPLIIHGRGDKDNFGNAYYDILAELKKNLPNKRGVLHCYAGPVELVDEFLAMGFYFGFNGVVTFKNAENIREILRKVPMEKVLTETDCPYLTPEPFRGKRNEPIFVEYVVGKIAEVKGMSFGDVERITEENAVRLFRLSACACELRQDK
jgi:TatD DNase family protein